MLLNTPFTWGQDTNHSEFHAGLSAYSSENFANARDHFRATISQLGESPELLHNWALSEYRMGHKALALGLWRRALVLRPGYSLAAEGRGFVERELAQNLSFGPYDSLWKSIDSISFYEITWLAILCGGFAAWLWILFWAKKRQAIENEEPSPQFPTIAALLTVIFGALTVLGGLRLQLQLQKRATVISEIATARSLPSEDGAELLRLPAGQEVIVERRHGDWLQVQLPSGGAGWVKTSELFSIN